MGIMSRALSSALKASGKPVFSPARCLNRKQHKTSCTRCVELCPGQVFSLKSGEPLKWDQCTGCGLCVSVCPSRCFAPADSVRRELSEGFKLSAPVSFACFDEPSPCTRRMECLGGIPWELAAALAMYTHVVFYVGACSRCAHKERVTCLHDNLRQIKDFLGPELFAARVHILAEGRFEPPASQEPVSRRALFADLGQNLGQAVSRTALSMLPLPDDDGHDGLTYRQILAATVWKVYENAQKQTDKPSARFGVRLPRYTTACCGCNICERICPQGALEVSPEQDGKRTIYITPWKCTGCGLCAQICPYKGISGIETVQVPHMNRLPLVRVRSTSCSMCGVALLPGTKGTLCPACARKAKKKVR